MTVENVNRNDFELTKQYLDGNFIGYFFTKYLSSIQIFHFIFKKTQMKIFQGKKL